MMEAVARVMMHLAKLAASSGPLRAPQTAFRQFPVLVWRCTKPGRQVARATKFVRWCLIFEGLQRGTGYVSVTPSGG
jgi:hypothetical protein